MPLDHGMSEVRHSSGVTGLEIELVARRRE